MHELKYNKSYPGGIPIVSITMSTFNRPDILENTLKSIRKNKTSLPYEIIVVDDGSPDRHYNFCICKKYSATYIYINFPDVRDIDYAIRRRNAYSAQHYRYALSAKQRRIKSRNRTSPTKRHAT